MKMDTAGVPAVLPRPCPLFMKFLSFCSGSCHSVLVSCMNCLLGRSHVGATKAWQPSSAAPAPCFASSMTLCKHLHLVVERLDQHSDVFIPCSHPTACAVRMAADNCHGFVAHFLNSIRYEHTKDWNATSLALAMFVSTSYVGGLAGFLRTWGPFCAVMLAGWYFGGSTLLLGWLLLALTAVAWFVFYGCCLAKSASNRILSV